MDNIKQGFKVCRRGRLSGWYFSARVNILRASKEHSQCHTDYRLLEWTKPKKEFGPLAVFKTVEDALVFQNRNCDMTYDLTSNEKVVSCFYRPSNRQYLQRRGEKPNLDNDGIGYPRGTDFASSVFLIKEVG